MSYDSERCGQGTLLLHVSPCWGTVSPHLTPLIGSGCCGERDLFYQRLIAIDKSYVSMASHPRKKLSEMTSFKDLRYFLCHFQFWGEDI